MKLINFSIPIVWYILIIIFIGWLKGIVECLWLQRKELKELVDIAEAPIAVQAFDTAL